MSENSKDDKKGFFTRILENGSFSETIVDLLKGKTVQECIDILEAAKRKILGRAVV